MLKFILTSAVQAAYHVDIQTIVERFPADSRLKLVTCVQSGTVFLLHVFELVACAV